jgi:ATPase subunit of ABC transporter with duplicated ATPase domains
LAQYSGTVIAVTHDRYFLDNVAGWILELIEEKVFLERELFFLVRPKSSRMALEEK